MKLHSPVNYSTMGMTGVFRDLSYSAYFPNQTEPIPVKITPLIIDYYTCGM